MRIACVCFSFVSVAAASRIVHRGGIAPLVPSATLTSTNKIRGGASARKGPRITQNRKVSKGGTATIPNEVFNLVKAIVGVGVLSLPAGIAAFGNSPTAVAPALCLIAAIGILSGFGFATIGRVCAYTGATSYREAWSQAVGARTSWIPSWSATLKTSMACLAFSMVLADTFCALLGSDQRTAVLLGLTTIILLPLCWLKDLASLAPFSLLGVVGMLYTGVAMAKRYLDGSYLTEATTTTGSALLESVPEALQPAFGNDGWQSVFSPNSLILVCMLSTAYMAHFNAPKVRHGCAAACHSLVTDTFSSHVHLRPSFLCYIFISFTWNSKTTHSPVSTRS